MMTPQDHTSVPTRVMWERQTRPRHTKKGRRTVQPMIAARRHPGSQPRGRADATSARPRPTHSEGSASGSGDAIGSDNSGCGGHLN